MPFSSIVFLFYFLPCLLLLASLLFYGWDRLNAIRLED